MKENFDSNITVNPVPKATAVIARSPIAYPVLRSKILKNDIEFFRSAFEKGLDSSQIMKGEKNLVHLAITLNKMELAKLLIENGGDLKVASSEATSPLILAINNDKIDLAELLINKGAESNGQYIAGYTPLMLAIERHATTLVPMLINPINIDIQDDEGYTALMWAVQRKQTATVKLLIEEGADIKIQDHDGCTALMWAAKTGHIAAVELLIEKGTDIEIKDHDGCTALMWAVKNGHVAAAKLLIEKGVNIEANDEYGCSVLMSAVLANNSETLHLIVDKLFGLDKKVFTLTASGWHKPIIDIILAKNAANKLSVKKQALTLSLLSKKIAMLKEMLTNIFMFDELTKLANDQGLAKFIKGKPLHIDFIDVLKQKNTELKENFEKKYAELQKSLSPLLGNVLIPNLNELIVAAAVKCEHLSVIKWLLTDIAKMPVEKQLHFACTNHKIELAQEILNTAENVQELLTYKNIQGQTALDLVEDKHDTALAKALASTKNKFFLLLCNLVKLHGYKNLKDWLESTQVKGKKVAELMPEPTTLTLTIDSEADMDIVGEEASENLSSEV